MAETDIHRQKIIASLFSSRSSDGTLERTYIGHIKIWENDASENGRKPRYIILAHAQDGHFIHKAKMNTNGTFSIGKTWKVTDLRSLEVIDRAAFNITLARTYKWETESDREQEQFLITLVRLFRDVTQGNGSLRLVGFSVPDSNRVQAADIPRTRTASTSSAAPSLIPPRRIQADPYDVSSPPYSNRSINGDLRPASPAMSSRSNPRYASITGSPGKVNGRAESPGFVPPSIPEARRSRNDSLSTARSNLPSGIATPRRVPSPVSYRGSATTPSGRTLSTATDPPQSISGFSASPPIRRSENASSRSENQLYSSSRRTSPERPSSNYRKDSQQSTNAYSAYSTSMQPGNGASSIRNRELVSRSNSPAPSISSLKSSNVLREPVPPVPVPAPMERPQISQRRDPNTRISFFDPANQALLDRLLADDTHSTGETSIAQTTMANIEDMLEGYEWASDDMLGRKRAQGAADQIESRLLDELTMLDRATVHSFLESDDRIAQVLQYIDDTDAELENISTLISSYKIHLNSVNDEIAYIQSQNKGLQVQTQNQKALLSELEQLLQTVHVDRETLLTLTQGSLEQTNSIQDVEIAAAELYKALLAGRDSDMAATMERLQEYRTHNLQFCKRLVDFLSIMFKYQGDMLLGKNSGVEGVEKGKPKVVNHEQLESYLGRYSGLMLYLKEMDEDKYSKICGIYFSSASDIHSKQIKTLCNAYENLLKAIPEEDLEQSFSPTPTSAGFRNTSGIRRAGTIVRSPLESRKDKDKGGKGGNLTLSDALSLLLEQISTQVFREKEFIADFLQINDAALTYADFMALEQYFRRQAARYVGLSSSTAKLVRGAMDLIFGFLPAQLKVWIDYGLSKDNIQIVGLLACIERATADAEERGNVFFVHLLEGQQQRLKSLFDRHIDEQVKLVEETKVTAKKRKGLAPFIKYFPVYFTRVESQLRGAESLEVRSIVDAAYERIVKTMFDSLRHMAKLDGEDEDKGQLNYHVIIIDNMHFFVEETSQQGIATINTFRKQAQDIYEANLSAYVKLVVRRPFAKMIDYFEGIERLLKTTAPSEVSKNNTYSRTALKRVLKEYNTKDVRKHIDALLKRTEKHFSETAENTGNYATNGGVPPGTVLAGVWKACEEEVLRITELFTKRISQCYSDSGLSLEYTAADVQSAFGRLRFNS